jgi:hypothetical protein
MILVHMSSILSTTLRMKEGLTYLMVTLAYHLPYTDLTRCDELGWFEAKEAIWGGVVGLLSVEMLIIVMVEITVFIAGMSHDIL